MFYDSNYSFHMYEKMEKLIGVTIGTIEENSFRLIAMKIVCN